LVDVRRVQSDEWQELRAIRLAALRDTPDAFGGTYEQSSSRPDEWWVDWARRSAESGAQAMFLAFDGDAPVGIAGTYLDDDDGRRNVIAMWVDPQQRGAGIGRALLDAVVEFVRAQGASELVLGVTDGNDAARRLYESYGFAENGESYPLREGSPLTVRELRLPL
jgi:ribosomal protein S18 acetylase RimI-like enzyme